jgi:NTP pyrophosphatase (non-canonical NTP hydrolase)
VCSAQAGICWHKSVEGLMTTTGKKIRIGNEPGAPVGSPPDVAAVLAASSNSLNVSQYQELSRATDRTLERGAERLSFPLLGLFGEVGSLLSELKKKQRDADSYSGYEASVVEELGDVLWYFSNLATRAHVRLSDLALRIHREPENGEQSGHQAQEIAFADLQPSLKTSGLSTQEEVFETTLLRLAGEAGKIVADFSAGRIPGDSHLLTTHMSAIFRALINAADAANVSLAEAAHRNLKKTFDRWPEKRIFPALFDEDDDPAEQLPRRIEMQIFEKTVTDRTYVFLRCNGINIGDRLTDNKLKTDDYRFHDVFHLAYAAILGWSPVTRALLRVKRKSRPTMDEAEDGARAILIEEGISTWVFNSATKLNNFASLSGLDYGLLKAVRELIAGYEAERCPLWLWEEAILKGYKVFREMRKHRGGTVVADLIKRTITFERMTQ